MNTATSCQTRICLGDRAKSGNQGYQAWIRNIARAVEATPLHRPFFFPEATPDQVSHDIQPFQHPTQPFEPLHGVGELQQVLLLVQRQGQKLR